MAYLFCDYRQKQSEKGGSNSSYSKYKTTILYFLLAGSLVSSLRFLSAFAVINRSQSDGLQTIREDPTEKRKEE